VDRAIEWFVALTALIVGLSHIVQARTWVEFFGVLHRLVRPGAFVNGAIHLVPGAVVIAGHPDWSWPGAPLTALGWLLVVKGTTCFLAPDLALRSMERAPSRPGFAAAGVVLLAIGAWAGYCAWQRG
jgi:hypothetical protein